MSFAIRRQQLIHILVHTEILREDQVRAVARAESLSQFLDLLQMQRAWWNPDLPAVNDYQRLRLAASDTRGLRDLDRDLRVNNFLILGELGSGGMGIVHKAWSIEFEQLTAIKRLTLNNVIHRDRFEREAKILRILDDPLIAQYVAFEPIEDGGGFLLAMEYIAGTTLKDFLQRNPPVDTVTATNWAIALLKALSHAHSRNVVHRDVTPRNIMIISKSGEVPVKLLDFGLGKIVGSLSTVVRLPDIRTETGAAIGTAPYMSPEQFNDAASVTGATDLYSLGCNLFEMLTGRPPFPGTQFVPLLRAHLHTAPPDIRTFRSDIPDPLRLVIMRLLDKDPGNRQSADEFRDILIGKAAVRSLEAVQVGNFRNIGTHDRAPTQRQDPPDKGPNQQRTSPVQPGDMPNGLPSGMPTARTASNLQIATLHPAVQWFRHLIPKSPLTAANGNIDSEVTPADLYLAFIRIRKGLFFLGLVLLLWFLFQAL